jgi:hypothetical protein
VILAAAWAGFASAAGLLEDLMGALAAVRASRATFVETRHSGLLREALVLRGTLAYRRPDFLQKHVQAPRDERVTMDGERITLESGAPARVVKLRAGGSSPIAALVAGIRATRAGDLAVLEEHFRVEAEGTRERWRMALTPRDAEMERYVRAIAVHGAGGRITRVEVDEASGDRSVLEIREEIE